jgi:hypothetical protein
MDAQILIADVLIAALTFVYSRRPAFGECRHGGFEHTVPSSGLALSLRPLPRLAQDEESGLLGQ